MKKIFTKTILILAFLGLSINNAKAQYVTIPDANFVTWLNNYYPNCMNGNQMDTTCNEIVSALYMVFGGTQIADFTGLQYFDNLINFTYTSANNVTQLPNLPKKLKILRCPGSQISYLSYLPDSLEIFSCNSNQFAVLPTLPSKLIEIDCQNNLLTNLPTLPHSIKYIKCQVNQLTTLPSLPDSLIELICTVNNLTSLPSLPSNLKELYCQVNQLNTLPTLPSSLNILQCHNNVISNLPVLPNSLVALNCYNNQLTNLPNLPNSLTNIRCSHNQITNLPTLPNQLTNLSCDNNLLTSLPLLPNTLTFLRADTNFITCLPVLPNNAFNTFYIYANPISCVPNYVVGMDSATLTLPLCQDNDLVNNPYGCGSASSISGKTFFDNDQNCLMGLNDLGLQNIKLNFYNPITNQFGSTYSNTDGLFNYQCLSGTYFTIVDTLNKPYTSNCIYPGLDSIVTITTTNPYIQNINFDIACKPGIDLGVQSIIEKNGVVFPGEQHTLQAILGDIGQWYGLYCSGFTSGSVTITITGPITFIGADSNALSPIVAGNTYNYVIPDFSSINYTSDFQLLFLTDTTAQIGDSICVHIEIAADSTDINPLNNIKDYCYHVINSMDPNYKEVYPTNVPPSFQDWLTYTIHFQNLGTAPAINIRLLDTLDSNLDAETFELINYSHYNTVTLMEGIIDFRFPNILLPDSASNPSGSQGFVQYRIKPKANLIAGTQIENTAHIYFDYNPAVVTNTTVNNFITTVVNKSLPQASRLWLYPNPSTGIFTISAKANIEVYNIVGDLIISENNATSIDLTAAPKGMYFVKLNGGKIEKLIKN